MSYLCILYLNFPLRLFSQKLTRNATITENLLEKIMYGKLLFKGGGQMTFRFRFAFIFFYIYLTPASILTSYQKTRPCVSSRVVLIRILRLVRFIICSDLGDK